MRTMKQFNLLAVLSLLAVAGCSMSRLDGQAVQTPGAAIAGEGPWFDEGVEAGALSRPITIEGRARPFLHLAHRGDAPVRLAVEYDTEGGWERREIVELPAKSWGFHLIEDHPPGDRLRVAALDSLTRATVWLTYVAHAERAGELDPVVQTVWEAVAVRAGEPSAGFDMLAHETRYLEVASNPSGEVAIQIDVSGRGDWHSMGSLISSPNAARRFNFWAGFNPKRVRLVSASDATITARLVYE
ncbi:MAG: hypothetical protein AAGH88_08610 [Planctomycetota bacterium]